MQRHRILVVDDEAGLRESFRMILKDGYDVTTASRGEEALTFLSASTFALAILDLKMPGMDGITLLTEIKKRAPDTQAIIVTAYGSLSTARAALQLGACDYLSKPFNASDVLAVVEKSIAQHVAALLSREEQSSLRLLVDVTAQELVSVERIKDLLFEASSDGFITLDSSGVIINVNGRTCDIYDLALADLIGSRIEDLALCGPRQQWNSLFAEIRTTPRVFDCTYRRSSGQELMLNVAASTLSLDDRLLVHLAVRDITEIAMLRRKTLLLQKFESLIHLTSGFVHDFRNTLTVIAGHAELASASMDAPEKVLSGLDIILNACESATRLTEELLSFSRSGSVSLAETDPTELFHDFVSMLPRRLLLTMDTRTDGMLPKILADKDQLKQVLLNLTLNASYALRPPGKVTLSLSSLSLSSTREGYPLAVPPGRYVVMVVADQGAGIPPDVLPRIFEPFFTTKAKGEGTGLGLTSVYTIVSRHKGYLQVESELGKGTTFSLYFPACNG